MGRNRRPPAAPARHRPAVGRPTYRPEGERPLRLAETIPPGTPITAGTSAPPLAIETCERTADWQDDGSPMYHAQIAGEPGYWARGRSRAEAIGELVRLHPGRFGLAIEHMGRKAR